MTKIKRGLQGVPIGESSVSSIDGKKGVLRYRGYDIKDLAIHVTYEEALYLLWNGALPNKKKLAVFKKLLKKERTLPKQVLSLIKSFPKSAHPMAVLRSACSTMSGLDKDAENISQKAVMQKALRLTSVFPTIVAAFERVRLGKNIIQPNNKLDHAENFLYMLRGKRASPYEEKMMDVCFVLHAEHGMNASTFSARVTASTLSDPYSAITSAVGTLKGPLHGGAGEKVLEMLHEINTVKNAETYICGKLKRHERVMGFGHRVYKVKDPRAFILEKLSKRLAKEKGNTKWYDISIEIERVMEREVGTKGLWPNVDFFSASTYYYLDIPHKMYPTIFACSRMGGWFAHILEQYTFNRLIRPTAIYVGPKRKRFVAIDKRT